jgi:cytochrome P450
VYNFNVPTFGKGVVYDVDQKVRTEQFRFFTEALKKDRLKKYVPMFAAEAEVRTSAVVQPAAAAAATCKLSLTVWLGRGTSGGKGGSSAQAAAYASLLAACCCVLRTAHSMMCAAWAPQDTGV